MKYFFLKEPYLFELIESVNKIDMSVETAEVQQGPGEFEITFQPKFGIESADNMLMFRDAVSFFYWWTAELFEVAWTEQNDCNRLKTMKWLKGTCYGLG